MGGKGINGEGNCGIFSICGRKSCKWRAGGNGGREKEGRESEGGRKKERRERKREKGKEGENLGMESGRGRNRVHR